MNQKNKYLLIIFLFFAQIGFGQDYRQDALNLYQKVQDNYYDKEAKLYTNKNADNRKYSDLWGLCAMVQVANEMEKAEPKKDYLTDVLRIIDLYYTEKKSQGGYDSYLVNLGGGDRYYDDNQWIGITLMDGYKRTKNPAYLKKAVMIFDFMMMGFDEAAEGGLYWREVDKLTKNTCSNAPGIILALQLYEATKNKKYLKTGQSLYDWTNKRLRSPEGIFYDNVVIKTDSIDKRTYSYNSGAMIQSNVYFYEITKNIKYLKEAQKIAESSLTKFYPNAKFRDDYWFNAVMLRGLQHLRKYDSNDKYIETFKKCANYALANEINEQGTVGKKRQVNLVNQSGMIEILLRLSEK